MCVTESRHAPPAAAAASVHQLLTKDEPKTKGAGSCSDVCQWKAGSRWVVEQQGGGKHAWVGG